MRTNYSQPSKAISLFLGTTIICLSLLQTYSYLHLRHQMTYSQLLEPFQVPYQIPNPDPPKETIKAVNTTKATKSNNTDVPVKVIPSLELCQRNCQPVLSHAACLAKCQQARINSGIFFIAAVAFVILFFTVGFCCMLVVGQWQHRQQRSLRNKVLHIQNQNERLLAVEDFQRQRKHFMDIMKKTQNQKHYLFISEQGSSLCREQISEITMKKEGEFQYQMSLRGRNCLGRWVGQGHYLLHQKYGLYLWFMKRYKKPEKAGQTGQFVHLIYEGKMKNQQPKSRGQIKQTLKIFDAPEYEGRWFYKGYEGDRNYSGFWKLSEQICSDATARNISMTKQANPQKSIKQSQIASL